MVKNILRVEPPHRIPLAGGLLTTNQSIGHETLKSFLATDNLDCFRV